MLVQAAAAWGLDVSECRVAVVAEHYLAQVAEVSVTGGALIA